MQVDRTDLAREDLRGINVWLVKETGGDLAVRILTAIRHRSTILEDFPHSGRPHQDGTRILPVHRECENWHVET